MKASHRLSKQARGSKPTGLVSRALNSLALPCPALPDPASLSPSQTEAQVREFARDQAVCCMDCTMPSAYMDPLAVNEPIIKTLK